MASVSQELAEQMIKNEGYYEDDPRVRQVITYTNAWGGQSWAILYEEDVVMDRYAPSEFIRDPKVLWSAT